MSDSTNTSLKFSISPTDSSAELGIRVRLDGEVLHENSHVKESYNFSHEISDCEADHELEIELFGKNSAHTKIDEAGNIVKDAMLTIKDVEFDGIDVSRIFTIVGKYHHDFNGTQSPTVAKFYSDLGCNGVVKVKFKTPVYLWLLENM